MASASVTNDFSNGTIGDADQVDQNFADLVNFFNTHVLHNHADNWPATMMRGLLGFSTRTSNSTGTTGGPIDVDDLTDAVTVATGRRYLILVHFTGIRSTVANDSAQVTITDGSGTVLSGTGRITAEFANIEYGGRAFFATDEPGSSGSKTYKTRLERVTGTGTVAIGASVTRPALQLILDIGASSI